jgi:chromatin segregation and condensation protein Rec8/ScpA/Scc1 (kleisin family)
MGLRFPPIERFLDRFRAVLERRSAFMLDSELEGLSRLEQAAAFLAVLELRKGGEVQIEQAAPFAPIRVSRLDVERSSEWRTARSA